MVFLERFWDQFSKSQSLKVGSDHTPVVRCHFCKSERGDNPPTILNGMQVVVDVQGRSTSLIDVHLGLYCHRRVAVLSDPCKWYFCRAGRAFRLGINDRPGAKDGRDSYSRAVPSLGVSRSSSIFRVLSAVSF